jgi:hypothetical protein
MFCFANMSDQSFEINGGQRITQHKRFVPYCTHLNFYFAKTSFMLETLSGMLCLRKTKRMGEKTLKLKSDYGKKGG